MLKSGEKVEREREGRYVEEEKRGRGAKKGIERERE